MQYVADLECNACRNRYPIRRRNIIRRPCKYCSGTDLSVVKTYGPISKEPEKVRMWCVDCHQRKDATSWFEACATCDCGGDRVPTYLLPQFSHTKPDTVPHATAVPWTKASVVKKITELEVSRTQKEPLLKRVAKKIRNS